MRYVGIDPASKTGFVALDQTGSILKAKELTGIGDKDPKRMVTLVNEVIAHIHENDIIVIEGFSFNSTGQGQDFQYGLGWSIRNELFKRNFKYYDVAPGSVKKYVGVTGWKGEPGNKKRLKGAAKKRAVMDAVKEHYNFVHSSDNVVDAYIMAQIAKSLHQKQVKYPYQKEVLMKLKIA